MSLLTLRPQKSPSTEGLGFLSDQLVALRFKKAPRGRFTQSTNSKNNLLASAFCFNKAFGYLLHFLFSATI